MSFQHQPVSTTPYASLTIIIPTLNEFGSIRKLIEILSSSLPGSAVIVADDGSNDGTREAVESAGGRVSLLDRSTSAVHGITASVLDALRLCETEFVAVMDADLQHPPEKLVEMFSALEDGAPIVVGCRSSFCDEYSRLRTILSRLIGRFASYRLSKQGMQVSDPLSGFFAARTSLLRAAMNSRESRFELRGYKVLFDFLKVLSTQSIPVREIFFHFESRRSGESKLRVAHIWHFLRALSK